MRKVLVVIGYQPDKLDLMKPKAVEKLTTWIQANQAQFEYTMSIVRVNGNRLMPKDDCLNDDDNDDVYRFVVDKRIEVIGYQCDLKNFNPNSVYYLCGISTGASVYGVALSLFSAGITCHVLKKQCYDRKGLDKEAFKLMEAYMPGVLIDK